MNLRTIGRGLVALALLLCPSLAFAQGSPLFQSGTVIPNHLLKSAGNGLQMDAGGLTGDANGRGVSPFSITDASGLGLCSNSAVTGGQHYAFCLGHDASGNALLSTTANGGALEKSIYLSKNGTLYEIPFVGAGGGNVVGPATTTVDHVATWNNNSGTLLKDVTALGLTGLTVTPAAGIGRAISTTQTVSGSVGGDTWYNLLQISSDNVVGPQQNLFGGGVYHICCGPDAKGYHFALAGRIDVTGAWSAADPEAAFAGIVGNARASVNAPSAGAVIEGMNANVDVFNNATGWATVIGFESDVIIRAGVAAPQVKAGVVVVQGALDAVQGSIDAGLHFTAAGTAPGWRNLILLDSLFGAQSIATTGTIFGMRGASTFVNGIDFSQATITGNAFTGAANNAGIAGNGDIYTTRMLFGYGNLPTIYPASTGSGWALTSNFSDGGGEVDIWNTFNTGSGFTFRQKTGASAARIVAEFVSAAPAPANTTLNLWVNSTAGQNLANVTLGAVDSGGAGFRALRVPN